MPADCEAASGVSAIVQVLPLSAVRSTRDFVEAPVPIHARSLPRTAMFVPLPANAPSFGSAGGSDADRTCVQCAPPSCVVINTNLPSTESLTAIPAFASQNAIASKKAFALSLVNCSVQFAPASVVL